MDMDVGHARHHRAAALIDDDRAGGRGEAALDARDPAVFDDHGRWPARGLRGVDDQAPGLDGVGFGVAALGGDQRGGAGEQMS